MSRPASATVSSSAARTSTSPSRRSPRLGLLAEGALGVDARGIDLGVRLDRGVEVAIRRVRAVGLLLDLLARRFQFLVDAVDDGLGFSLNFLGRDADGGAGGRVEAADQLWIS